jgi:hypothetical protein
MAKLGYSTYYGCCTPHWNLLSAALVNALVGNICTMQCLISNREAEAVYAKAKMVPPVIVSIDIIRAHAAILGNREAADDWNLFSQFSNYEDWTWTPGVTILAGEYYVSRVWTFGDMGCIPEGLRPRELVVFAISKGLLTWSDITGRLLADQTLSRMHFKAFVDEIYTNDAVYHSCDVKALVNHLCGSLGPRYRRDSKGLVCQNRQFMEATVADLEAKGQTVSLDFFGDLFFIRCETETPRTESALGIHRQISAGVWIRLYQLVEDFMEANPGATTISWNTDCASFLLAPRAKYVAPRGLYVGTDKGRDAVGMVQRESGHLHEKMAIPAGGRIVDRTIRVWATVNESDFNGQDLALKCVKHCGSLMICGGAGFGKSTLLGKYIAGLGHTDYQALSFTNSAVQNLIGNGISNTATFDAFFELGGGNGTVTKVQQLSHRRLILVDEYSNASPVHLGLVAWACDLARSQGRSPPDVILCGDYNQCLPVGAKITITGSATSSVACATATDCSSATSPGVQGTTLS